MLVIRDWPPITNPELLERQALDDERFRALMRDFAGAAGRRPYGAGALEHALAYPWQRPERSYLLRDGAVQLLHELAPEERAPTIDAFATGRHPIVAIGSNAAPRWLAAKCAHFPEERDRTALVLTGRLHDMDVGPAATIAAYGAMPATLIASPGTCARAAILWLTDAQVEQLTWSEISYRLGRLDSADFTADEVDVEIHSLFAYVNRFGTFCPDGEPVALDAVPATGRIAPARTQRQLLDAAGATLGLAGAEAVVRAAYDDLAGLLDRAATTVWRAAERLDGGHWTPYPAEQRLAGG
ncbi:MAG TPA: hypothetical protein VFT50_11880 [Baekduia sp.]|nr:hypothetical protein [Baekduia sp.]